MQRDQPLGTWALKLEQLMRQAGAAAMAHFGSSEFQTKEDFTPVTAADRASEEVLVAGLERLFPEDSIVSEEGGGRERSNSRCWYVDPIDGTAAFVEGLAHWGPVVGCLDENGPSVGAVFMPRTGDYFFAVRGEGAWLNGERLARLEGGPVDRRSVVYVPSRFHQYVEFDFEGKLRSLGGTAAHLVLVASGSAVGTMVPAGWKLWDVVGPFCLLKEVGAEVAGQLNPALDLRRHPTQAFAVGHPSLLQTHFSPSRFRMRNRRNSDG